MEQLQTKVQDLERFIEFIQLKQPDDLDLPKVPKEDNRSKKYSKRHSFYLSAYLSILNTGNIENFELRSILIFDSTQLYLCPKNSK